MKWLYCFLAFIMALYAMACGTDEHDVLSATVVVLGPEGARCSGAFIKKQDESVVVLTAYHCVDLVDKEVDVEVTLDGNKSPYRLRFPATVCASNPSVDAAVLCVDAPEELTPFLMMAEEGTIARGRYIVAGRTVSMITGTTDKHQREVDVQGPGDIPVLDRYGIVGSAPGVTLALERMLPGFSGGPFVSREAAQTISPWGQPIWSATTTCRNHRRVTTKSYACLWTAVRRRRWTRTTTGIFT